MSMAEKMKANLRNNSQFFAELDLSSAKNSVAAIADIKPTSIKPTSKGYKEKYVCMSIFDK